MTLTPEELLIQLGQIHLKRYGRLPTAHELDIMVIAGTVVVNSLLGLPLDDQL